VHTWGDIVHAGVTIAGQSVEQIITSFTETWYEIFELCVMVLQQPAGLIGAPNSNFLARVTKSPPDLDLPIVSIWHGMPQCVVEEFRERSQKAPSEKEVRGIWDKARTPPQLGLF